MYAIAYTALNSMIETASFTTPSPKIHENKSGCSSYLTIETAAMTSEEHINEHRSKISMIVSSN